MESTTRWQTLARQLPRNGGTSQAELRLLFDLSSRVRKNCIVEIGSFVGRSTIVLAKGSMEGHRVPVYAIDPHEAARGAMGVQFGPRHRAAFFRNMIRAKVTSIVRLVNLPSLMVAHSWEQPIALLFIDGDHHYKAVSAEFAAWSTHVIPGGVVLFHDAFNPQLGIHRVVSKVLADDGYDRLCDVDKICAVRKR